MNGRDRLTTSWIALGRTRLESEPVDQASYLNDFEFSATAGNRVNKYLFHRSILANHTTGTKVVKRSTLRWNRDRYEIAMR